MRDVLDQLTASTGALVAALEGCDLLAPTRLPGWSRLTIACHLRYGADALDRMTRDALDGRPTAFYPGGRDVERPATLEPAPGETPAAVVDSLATASAGLRDTWSRVSDWDLEVDEPEGIFDSLRTMAILRLTEIEVHGTDLDVGLASWSDVLVAAALPRRLARLQTRVPQGPGAWALCDVRVGDPAVEPEVIEASDRDALALLLGRAPQLSPGFSRAFPGP